MSWDLQDIGAHLMEKHGYNRHPELLPRSYHERRLQHQDDHDDPIGLGHVHDLNDPRIIKED